MNRFNIPVHNDINREVSKFEVDVRETQMSLKQGVPVIYGRYAGPLCKCHLGILYGNMDLINNAS